MLDECSWLGRMLAARETACAAMHHATLRALASMTSFKDDRWKGESGGGNDGGKGDSWTSM